MNPNFVTVPFQCGDCGHIYKMAIDDNIDEDLLKSTITITCSVCKNQSKIELEIIKSWMKRKLCRQNVK